MTMSLIEHIELASDASVIEFDLSGVSGYTDLYFVGSLRTDGNGNVNPQFNGSGANFSIIRFYGTGSSVASSTSTTRIFNASTSSQTANTFGNFSAYIPNAFGSEYKSISTDAVQENNATAAIQHLSAGLWSVGSALTSVGFSSETGNFLTYSSITCYGITAGSDGTTTVS